MDGFTATCNRPAGNTVFVVEAAHIDAERIMNTEFRKNLPGSSLDYFDTRAACEAIKPGSYDTLPYTSRILAEQLVRRCA
ncbi:MAG: hypothetical protein VW274_09260, partial [Thalassolituus sp.]